MTRKHGQSHRRDFIRRRSSGPLPEGDGEWFQAADEEHVRREKAKARKLRRSQWWKNQLATGVCYYCKRRFPPSELTMDHVVPIIRGGRTTKRNVVPCCRACNAAKQYHLPVEWKENDVLKESRDDAGPAPRRDAERDQPRDR